MAIYMIQAGENGPVKIGTADDVAARLRELQCGNHLCLTVLRVLPGGPAGERWLHRHFAERRLRGEWFHFCLSMLTVLVPEALPRVTREARIIDALGGNAEVARALGEKTSNVWRWRERGIPARFWHRIAAMAEDRGVGGVSLATLERPLWQRQVA